MRLVRFEDESGGFAIELHPLLTVVSGLPQHIRERLIQTVSALPHGGDPGGRGALEVYGVFLDLNRETLDLLEMNQDLDVVLKAMDLPGAEPAEDADDPASWDAEDAGAISADPAVTAARQSLVEADARYRALMAEADSLRHDLEQVDTERRSLARQVDEARNGLDSFALAGLKAAREELVVLEAAAPPLTEGPQDLVRFGGDPVDSSSGAGPPDGDAPTSRGEGEPPSPPDAADVEPEDVSFDNSEVERRIEELIAESNRLKSELKRLHTIDPAPVRRAFDDLMSASATPKPSVSPEAAALAAAWVEITERLAEINEREGEGLRDVAALIRERDEAYDRFVFAENALKSPVHDPAMVAELESVHDEIFELGGKGLRLGASKIKRRQEELRARENELLEQLGFDTWTLYVMGAPSADVMGRRRAEMETAHQAYERAEAAVAESQQGAPSIESPEMIDAVREQGRLRGSIAQLLGFDPGLDPLPALQNDLVAPESSNVSVDDAAASLRQALADTGAELPSRSLTADELESIAAGWLEAMEALPGHIAEAEEIRSDIEWEINELVSRLETGSPAGGSAVPTDAATPPATDPGDRSERSEPGGEIATLGDVPAPAVASPELLAARMRVRECEERAARHENAVSRLAELQADMEKFDAMVRDAQSLVATHDAAVAEAERNRHSASMAVRDAESDAQRQARPRRVDVAPERPARAGVGSAGAEAVEWYVLARLAQQRSVSFVGSVPIVIDNAFTSWSVDELRDVFERLERMSEVIQIVMLTEDPDISAWARSLGSTRASVLDLRSTVPG